MYLARAASWCETHGTPGEAFAYAHDSGDLAQAGRIALAHRQEFVWRGQIETLRLWLDRCTDEEIASDPQLSIVAAWVFGYHGDAARARRFFAAAERGPLDVASVDGASSLRTALANLRTALAPDGIPQMLRDGELVYASEKAGTRSFLSGCRAMGVAYVLLGRPQEAITVLRETLALSSHPPELATCGSSVSAIWPSRPQTWAIGETRNDGRSKRPGWSPTTTSTRRLTAPSRTRRERSRTSYAVTTRRPRASSRTSGDSAHGSARLRGSTPISRCAEISLDLGDLAGSLECAQVAGDALQGYPDAGTLPARLQRLEGRIRRGQDYGLTPAELRLVAFLPTHLSLQEIAHRLYLARPTVKTHVASIYDKLGVPGRSEAVEIIEQAGLGSTQAEVTAPDPDLD